MTSVVPPKANLLFCGLLIDSHIKSDMATEDTTIRNRAGFWVRLCAMVIDYIIGSIIFMIGTLVMFWLAPFELLYEPSPYERLSEMVAWILVVLYWTIGVSRYEGTIGKRLLGLRVLRTDLSRCGFW